MKNKRYSMPLGMLTRKFYCHECGARLEKKSKTRTVKRGDPDYREHSMIGHTHYFGDVELTEYDAFRCPSCDKIISYDDQCVIEKIQKRLGKHILSQSELDENAEAAKASIERKAKITQIIVWTVFAALFAFAVYMSIRTGEFSLNFYL